MRKIFHTVKTILYGLIEHTCFCRLGLLCPIDPREHTREEKKTKKTVGHHKKEAICKRSNRDMNVDRYLKTS